MIEIVEIIVIDREMIELILKREFPHLNPRNEGLHLLHHQTIAHQGQIHQNQINQVILKIIMESTFLTILKSFNNRINNEKKLNEIEFRKDSNK